MVLTLRAMAPFIAELLSYSLHKLCKEKKYNSCEKFNLASGTQSSREIIINVNKT